jgi:hypothetical protein
METLEGWFAPEEMIPDPLHGGSPQANGAGVGEKATGQTLRMVAGKD